MGGGAESIDGLALERLPQKYVVKSNHWSGDALICSGANPIPTDRMREIDLRLNSRYGGYGKSEWPYWHIAPRVFVEEYLEDQFGQLVDYKIFCFNGEPKLIMICKDRQTERKKLFFDSDWKLLPITDPKYPTIGEGTRFPKPESLHEMLDYCSRLCEDVPFVRADFYDVEGDCRFGELTLYPECGIDCRFQPAEWNAIIGGWLDLPEFCRNPKFAFGPEYAPRGSGLGSRR